ncbi:MAG TPA: cell division protein ZapB [Gammaproteobacteria bacterium]|nr:cell division protein ZapB [Gammaproteobacteria bacterium]HRA42954.1 cell division protein ZapB [Gammaproteobacteria bacterium]
MSNALLLQLEVKLDDMIETLEILRLQVSDLEEKNDALQTENAALKTRQSQWEQGLSSLLNKLDHVNPDSVQKANVENLV